jgi:hypothetical protein
MSKRNSRAAKARRREDRPTENPSQDVTGLPLVEVTPVDELVELARRGERLPCGCDAHKLLHDAIDAGAGYLPPGWQRF